MFSLGETLRRARLEQNLDLCALAARTKINIKYLEAIEADNRQSLPSSFFYRSFVDQYARALSLDTQQIGVEIDRVLSADAPLPLPGYGSVVSRNVSPMKSDRFHSWRTYGTAAALVLVVAGCAGVYSLWRDSRSTFSAQAVIQKVRSLGKTTIAQANSSAKKPVQKRMERALPALPPIARYVKAAASETPATPASVSPSFEPALPNNKVTLDLLAHEATWVSVSSDGKPVFSGVMQPNQSKTVGGKESAKMRVGNAAGIEVRLNGKLLGPLGARGQVLIVLFTPDNFQIVAPPKESD
jgi:cytoskeleton protein RodZ